MAFFSPLVTALAVPLTGSGNQEGSGRVERQLDATTYTISVGRDKLTARVTEGTLSVGQRVNITVQNGRLLIEGGAAKPAAGQNAAADVFLQSGVPSAHDLKGALDGIMARLSGYADETDALRQADSLFKGLAPDLAAIEPKLTDEITKQFRALAAPDDAPPEPQTVQVVLAQLDRLKERLGEESAPAAEMAGFGRSLVVQRSLPEGVFAFSSVEDAQQFLSADGTTDEAFARELARRLSEDGVITVRTTACGTLESVATILLPGELAQEVESQAGQFSSRAFQSIPPVLFEQLLSSRGSVNFDLLRQLDRLALDQQMPAASIRAGSREAQTAALEQWLHTAVDSGVKPAAIAALLPVFSASSIIDSLEELAASGPQLQGQTASLPSAESFSLTAEALGTADRAQLLPLIFKRLGFDVEHTLAVSGTPDKNALKPMLLELAGTLAPPQALDSGDEAGSAPFPDALRTLAARLDECEQEAVSLIATAAAPGAPDKAADPAQQAATPQGPSGLVAHARQELQGMLQARFTELKSLVDRLPGSLNEAASGSQKSAEAFLAEARNRFSEQLNLVQSDVQKFAKQLSSLLSQGGAPSPEEESAPIASKTAASAQNPLAALQNSLPELSQKLEEFRPSLIRQMETFLREPAHEGSHRAESAAKGASADEAALQGSGAKDAPSAHVRQNLETLLTRVESFQLLARQVETASGGQQILAMPIKIGNEWTEMHVRFVRRDGRSKGPGRQNYAVYINVAPALLGAISARMDYHSQKSLNVTMEFESGQTLGWFASRKADLRKALLALGLPSPHIAFFKAPAVRSVTAEAAAPAAATTIIDVKV